MYENNLCNWYVRGCILTSKANELFRNLRSKFRSKFTGTKIKNLDTFVARAAAHGSSELKNAIRFSGLPIKPYEVFAFAYFAACASCAAATVLYISILCLTGFYWLVYLLPAVVVSASVGIYMFLVNYPKHYANRLKVKTIGKMPEVINYLGIGMRLTPCIDKAVEIASENTDEPMATELKKILWHIHLRKHPTAEDALIAFAQDWSDWNEDFKRALYVIRAAGLEKTDEGLERCIDKSLDIIITGTKNRINSFAESLTAPTMILFSLGILLPMLIGTMLPMLCISGLTLGVLEFVLLMLVAFPVGTFLYASTILEKRPGTTAPPNIPNTLTRREVVKNLILSAALSTACAGTVYLMHSLGIVFSPVLYSLFAVMALSVGIGYYCRASVKSQKKQKDKIQKIENELPDALFQIGSRIAENDPVETAIAKFSAKNTLCNIRARRGISTDTFSVAECTAIAELFSKISFSGQLRREPLDSLLFGTSGILKNYPSRNMKTALHVITEATKKDNIFAGRTIIKISNYFRDLKNAESEIRNKLSSVTGMMLTTGKYFAPLIIGVTVALYTGLFNTVSNVHLEDGFFSMGMKISSWIFALIMGIYLIMLAAIIVYFCTGIAHDSDKIERRYSLGNVLPISAAVFMLSEFLGEMLIRW